MTLLFFQVTDTAKKVIDTAKNAAQQLAAAPKEIHFGDLVVKGGWVMVPIGLLAIIGLVIFFERYFTIRKASKNESNLMVQVRSSIHTGNLESAIAICRNSNTPLGRMLQKGLLSV